MEKKHISILGGTDGFGKWLTEFILKDFEESVCITITGRNQEKGEAVAQKLGVKYQKNNIQAVKTADIVIYSVSIAHTKEVIETTIDHVRDGAIIGDVTSIKKFPSEAMKKCTQKGIKIIPTHPMFGPYVNSIAGQVIVLTPDDIVKDTPEYQFLKRYGESKKAKIMEVTPVYHDKMMAVVQGLTHFNMFVVGETMKRLGFNIQASMDFVSPIYKLMISSVGRYLSQNPKLYADIQMYNDEILEVHEKFLDTAANFHVSVKNGDTETFCRDIIAAREFLGEENCDSGQLYTDKIIYLIGKQIEKLKRNLGKTIELTDIYSGKIEVGILTNFTDAEMFLDNGKAYSIDSYDINTL